MHSTTRFVALALLLASACSTPSGESASSDDSAGSPGPWSPSGDPSRTGSAEQDAGGRGAAPSLPGADAGGDAGAKSDANAGATATNQAPASPSGTTPPPAATTPPPTTTTTPPTTTVAHFSTLPVGSALPTDADCSTRIRRTAEVRPDNATPNGVKGTSPNGRFPRVTGSFTGTTDEILQWVACKWGIDEDLVRAQAVTETRWHQSGKGDMTTDQSACWPGLRTTNGSPCPESVGILQVRYLYHMEAFKDGNALYSTSYNADYAYAVWRSCYEGRETWLNDEEKGAVYAAGDAMGCVGVWFAGRWHTPDANTYINEVQNFLAQKYWTTSTFKSE